MTSRILTLLTLVVTVAILSLDAQTPAAQVTLFEGARLIVGDGTAPIDNSAFIVDGTRFTQVGRAGQLKAPAGAARVSLIGKTVMPGIIDTHVHMPTEPPALEEALRRKAYYGSTVVMSLGTDAGDLAVQVRQSPIAGAARLLTAGRGITAPGGGRSDGP
jgi:imidazolonepropionase-like amidohydrolase